MPPRCTACEEQIRDVRACDHQHECDDDEKGNERPLEALAQRGRARAGGLEHEWLAQKGRLELHRQRTGPNLRLHGAKRSGGRFERHARLHPEHDVQPRRVVVELDVSADRKDQVEGAPDLDAEKPGRRHPDDRHRGKAERDGRADHARRAAEPLLPQLVADHGCPPVGAATRQVILRREQPANDGRHAERVEEVAADKEAIDRHRLAGYRQRALAATVAERQRAVEGLPVTADLIEGRVTEGGPRAAVAPVRQDHQALRMGHRQRPQDEAVDEREDRGVRADAERERQDGYGGDDRSGDERADGETEILHRGLRPGFYGGTTPICRINPS